MAEEPATNVSGGAAGGGTAAEFDPEDAQTRVETVIDRLGELYWQKTYGGRDAFECLVRTVLSQNTSDKAS
jgi:endonuclease-3